MPSNSLKVAVIGAGVAGLVATRELQREGHRVTVFEKQNQLGGTWVYDPRVESDPLGIDPNREIIHSSLYSSLLTNFPRHCMGFSDYPFNKIYADSRIFPSHEEVLKFLNDFAEHFRLTELIRFNTDVICVEQLPDSTNDEWIVESRTGELIKEEVFEAVVVCNGHYAEPRLADFPGKEKWPRKQIHSHNYRVRDPFQDQVVVIIGGGPSALDISRDIAQVAKQVHLSTRSPSALLKLVKCSNVTHRPKIDYVDESGTVAFEDGSSVKADIIFHCTGYKFSFPFLKTNGIVTVDDNRVGPLYKHVFSPQLGPSLSFIGLPYGLVGFGMRELQAKWISLVLSGKVLLPSKDKMLADTQQYYTSLDEQGIPKRHTHSLKHTKFEYMDWLVDQVGGPPVEERVKKIFKQLFMMILISQDSEFREWDVDAWLNSTA